MRTPETVGDPTTKNSRRIEAEDAPLVFCGKWKHRQPLLDVPDHGQYLSWWRSFQSAVLVPNKLTPEPNDPLFFNLQWWGMAQLSRFTGLDYAPVYQGF